MMYGTVGTVSVEHKGRVSKEFLTETFLGSIFSRKNKSPPTLFPNMIFSLSFVISKFLVPTHNIPKERNKLMWYIRKGRNKVKRYRDTR